MAAVNIRLPSNCSLKPAMGVTLLAHLKKPLMLPPQPAVGGKTAIMRDRASPVIHCDKGQPHGLGTIILQHLEKTNVKIIRYFF